MTREKAKMWPDAPLSALYIYASMLFTGCASNLVKKTFNDIPLKFSPRDYVCALGKVAITLLEVGNENRSP